MGNKSLLFGLFGSAERPVNFDYFVVEYQAILMEV
jgi:hypothetical protein